MPRQNIPSDPDIVRTRTLPRMNPKGLDGDGIHLGSAEVDECLAKPEIVLDPEAACDTIIPCQGKCES